jgi:hypothetical protein
MSFYNKFTQNYITVGPEPLNMASVVLNYPRSDAMTVIKAAFENTRGIEEYHDNGFRIVGKSGGGLASYGEKVTVEIPENQSDAEETMISVTSSKEVSANITANPDKYESRFLTELNKLRDKELEEVLELMNQQMNPSQSKEVNNETELSDGSSKMVKVMIAVAIMFFFFQFMIFASI